METKLEEIAAKARKENKLKFTSLCHHVTRELVWESLKRIPNTSAAGIDGMDAKEAKETFEKWIEPMLQAVHRKGYKAPPVKRVWIPKAGKTQKRPIGIPCIADRSLQRSVAKVLSVIYEQDFLPCSFGGRTGLSAHHALATFNEVVSKKKIGWVLEADLKDFFGSLNQEWLIKFVNHRVEDPRIINLIQRWLKAGVIENDQVQTSEVGTPQGGPISVLLSNIYLHYVLDLWFEKAIRPRLKGETYLMRYIDDFVVCFQNRQDAIRFREVLGKRLGKFSLTLEANKTRIVEFGRFAQKDAKKGNRKAEVVCFLGFTHYCTLDRRGNFQVGRKTEKTKLKRALTKLGEGMRLIRHWKVKEQVNQINQELRGHYGYYGLGGNYSGLIKVYRYAEKYWRKMLCSRSWKSYVTWEKFIKIREYYSLAKPVLRLTYAQMQKMAVL